MNNWWIGLRSLKKDRRKVIITLSFSSEGEAEREYVILGQGLQPGSELCKPVMASSEKEALRKIKELMGW